MTQNSKMHRRLSLSERLLSSPGRFEFLSATRILLKSYPLKPFLRGHLSLELAPTDIQSVLPPSKPGHPPQVWVNFFGIGTPGGSLPEGWVNYFLNCARYTHAPARFFDIFNNRLLWALFETRARIYPEISSLPLEKQFFSKIIQALAGIDLSIESFPPQIPISAVLSGAALFWQIPHSSAGLTNLLRASFEIPASVQKFQGGFLPISPEDQSRLGHRFSQLGSFTLGTHVRDVLSRVHITLGPMDLSHFDAFLQGKVRSDLENLTKVYLPQDLEVVFSLILKESSSPPTYLGKKSWLGIRTWLGPHLGQSTVRLP